MIVAHSARSGESFSRCDNFNRCFNLLGLHTISQAGEIRTLCCECYVTEGHPPADWHPLCMATWDRLQREREALKALRPEDV